MIGEKFFSPKPAEKETEAKNRIKEKNELKSPDRRGFLKKAGKAVLAAGLTGAGIELGLDKKEARADQPDGEKPGVKEMRERETENSPEKEGYSEEMRKLKDDLYLKYDAEPKEGERKEKTDKEIRRKNFDFIVQTVKGRPEKYPLLAKELEKLNDKQIVEEFAKKGFFLNIYKDSAKVEKIIGEAELLTEADGYGEGYKEIGPKEIKDSYAGIDKLFSMKDPDFRADFLIFSEKSIKPGGFNIDGVSFVNRDGVREHHKKINAMAKDSPGWKDYSLEQYQKSIEANELCHHIVEKFYDKKIREPFYLGRQGTCL